MRTPSQNLPPAFILADLMNLVQNEEAGLTENHIIPE
jgi:hypothetical protein